MIANIIICAVLAAWVVGVVVYIAKKKIAAKKSGAPSCVGCSCGCGGCSGKSANGNQ